MKKVHIFLLVVFSLITFFANRAALPTDIMESRNIVTAREIVSDRCWLVPTMNGELRLEKPPLPTWVAAGIEEVCPDNLAAQRTAAGVMGCVWTLYLFLLVRYISRRDDLAAATVLVFLTCYNVVLMGRSATWDIYCHAFMMGAIYYLTRALYDGTDEKKQRRNWQWFALAGVFMGLSFLSKGPVSFYTLLLPYLITLIGLPSPQMKGKWKPLFVMVVFTLAIGSWWYIYLLTEHPTEVSAVIHKESGAWSNHNVRPWWYYWRFFLEMGAWAILMVAALVLPYWKRHISLKREYLFAITWAIGSLILLSLMPEKKTRYLLPSLAPCSMVVGCLIVHFTKTDKLDKVSKLLYIINGLTISVIVVALPTLIYHFGVRSGMVSIRTDIVATVFMLFLAGWLVWNTLQWHPFRFTAGIAGLFVFAEIFLLGAIGYTFGNHQAHSISAVRTDKRVNSLPFYHNAAEPLRIELVYEANRKILSLNLNDRQAVRAAMPFVLVSQHWTREEILPDILSDIDTISIGTFDDNKHPRSDSHYTSAFINHVTILKQKENEQN